MRRHDLVFLRPGADVRLLGAAGEDIMARLAEWLLAGRPLVVARQRPEETELAGLFLALTLPASLARRRLAVLARPEDVIKVTPPRAVASVSHLLAAADAAVLSELAATLAAEGVPLGVYGSLAWEAISGETYRHPASDLDVIGELQHRRQLAPTLAALALADRRLSFRLDGELRFPGGAAVAWRELLRNAADSSRSVLSKGFDFLAVTPVAVLLESLS